MASLKPTRQVAGFAIVLLATFIATADNSSSADLRAFAGEWQEDLSKTVLTPDETRKYEQNPDGTMSVTIGANAYRDTFRIDGKPHPEVPRPDVMQTWTQTGSSSWESTDTKDGQVISTVKRTVSSDGKTLTFVATYKRNGRKDTTVTTVYSRISAEKDGLAGTWKPVSGRSDTADVFTFRVTPDGTLSYAGLDASFSVKPDGNRYPVKDEFDGVSLRSSGDRTISFTFFLKGKPFEIDTFTLSSDGQSFTETDRNVNSNATTATFVYRKRPT